MVIEGRFKLLQTLSKDCRYYVEFNNLFNSNQIVLVYQVPQPQEETLGYYF